MKKSLVQKITVASVATTLLSGNIVAFASSENVDNGKWVTGDFHTHTYLTDGSRTQGFVLENAFDKFGLDWVANSEHGGKSSRDVDGAPLPQPLWRWETLRDHSWSKVLEMREKYPDKKIIQGVEWNVPQGEHASVGIITDERTPISDFEYMFDKNDADTSRADEGLGKYNKTEEDALKGLAWLQENYQNNSYTILNHPSRQVTYDINEIRNYHNTAPDVFLGFEGIPGHQKSSSRGGYNNGSTDDRRQTYGGADKIIAEVGGIWDALLGEGRRIFTYTASDFHNEEGGDFLPGEYNKTYSYTEGDTYMDYLNSLKSGNSFSTTGDLINALEFTVKSSDGSATMGDEVVVKKGESAEITIKFKSPEVNNNGDKPVVNHVDIIAGSITGKVDPTSPEYTYTKNDSTKVIATFTDEDWTTDKNGYKTIKYTVNNVENDMYFRLRGTNMAPNTENQTDELGNPLNDKLVGNNNDQEAFKDLWFYSNPVFVDYEGAEAKLPNISGIEGKAGVEFKLPMTLNELPTDVTVRSAEMVFDIPNDLEVKEIELNNNVVKAGDWDYNVADGKLRVALADVAGNPIYFNNAGSGDKNLVTLTLALKEDKSQDASTAVKMSQLTFRGQDDVDVDYDTTNATSVITFAQKEVAAANARELYASEGTDVIPENMKAVAVEFTLTPNTTDIKFGEQELYYSPEFTNNTGKVTYVGLVSVDTSLEDLSNIKNYTLTETETQANTVVFGDIKNDGTDAQDALSAITAWLRKEEGKVDNKGMIAINVNGDGKINTRDAIDVVDNFISGKDFGILSK